MSRYNPERIFKPRRTAVVEASEKNGSIGNTLMKKLRKGGFR
jgi:acyl-CoA synthetase (NDP forming)